MMPNFAHNMLTVQSGDSEEFFRRIRTENKEDEYQYLIDFRRIVPYNRYYKEENWYEWNKANWGTKWNSSCSHIKNNTIRFNTAWTPPIPIINKLAELFPNHVIKYEWAEEEIIAYAGSVILSNGNITERENYKGTEAARLYFKITEANPREFGMDPVTFKYLHSSPPIISTKKEPLPI